MGLTMLPDELTLSLIDRWPCREVQFKQLSSLLSPNLARPSTIVVHGTHATGKTSILQAYLEAYRLQHATVQCRESITGRHLLERAVAAVNDVLRLNNGEAFANYEGRCENLSVLAAHLQRLLEKQKQFVLVLDGVDKQRDAQPTLLPALARLGEFVPNLTVVLVVQYPPPRFLHKAGVAHVHFAPYSREQSIRVLSRDPPDIFSEPWPIELRYDKVVHEEDKAWLWPRFCAAVWDSLAQNAARDFFSYRDVCHKLWPSFVGPIIKGDYGTRDFSKLIVAQRRLFQDESVLLDSIVPTTDNLVAAARRPEQNLPYYTRWLIISAYLASYNPQKLDALYFMKATERKRRKKGGGLARAWGRQSQTRKIARHLIAPSAFTLDRLLSILHAILPHDFRSTIDIYTEITTLSSLRFLAKSAGIGSGDPLEAGGKWRAGSAVTWEFTQTIARSLKFDIVDYIAE